MIRSSLVRFAPAMILAAAAGLAHAQCSYQQLVAGDPELNAFGGDSVAIDGNYIMAGSSGKATAWGADAGEVYCYSTFGPSWGQVAHIIPATAGGASDHFGVAVAMGSSAQLAVIGAPGHGGNAGIAYIFRRDLQTNLWSQVTTLDPQFNANAWFGNAVAMNTQGTIAVVGAPYADVTDLFGTSSEAGRAEVYVRNPDGTWSYQFDFHQYDASIRHTNDFYGTSVGVDGTTAVVGCPRGDSAVNTDAGYIHIWSRNAANQWSATGEIYAPDQAAYDYFGQSVAISGSAVIVGAPGASHLGMADAGCAYIYRYSNGAWVYDSILHATDAAASDAFGSQVSIYGDYAVIASSSSVQKVYVFHKTAAGEWVQEARYNNPGAANDAFGDCVATNGVQMVAGAWGFDTPNFGQMGCEYVWDLPVGQSDSCAGAWPIAQGTFEGCTTICTVDGSSSCGGAGAGPDAWFAYTAPATGTVTIDTQGSSFDTVLSIHAGCPGDVASTLQCNDDNSYPSQLWSRIHMQVAQGQTYLIRVAGYNGASGAFTLNVGPVTGCYANCDGSTTAPILNVLDFSCFLNKFAAGDPYANCDNSTTPPVLNVLDFSCFLNKFAAGCT
jgi:hypothetical protein